MIEIQRKGWDSAKAESLSGNELDTVNHYDWTKEAEYKHWQAFFKGVNIFLRGEPRL